MLWSVEKLRRTLTPMRSLIASLAPFIFASWSADFLSATSSLIVWLPLPCSTFACESFGERRERLSAIDQA